ncbi:MAG: F0F1 ATP synthase subunit B [Oscillospiraceae bacterium]|nr:F0F1 ATP synthase subunit B [Oscillospiraceae bacterium]
MISINLSELIWTIINFFLLMFLLKRFLYTPILRFMAARQARVDAGLEAERSAQAQVQENDQRLADEKTASREEAKRILNTAGEAARQRREETLSQAREAAGKARQQAQAELTARCEDERDRLSQARPELAELLAERLLDDE